MAYRNYGPNAGYVIAQDGTGDFLTIGSGLTVAASLGGSGTLYIKDGTYTENPTCVAGWNLVAWDADAITPNVIINGKCTFTGAGTITISGINLQTNSDYCLAVTGSAASIVYLKNCNINCSSNTGINYSSSSGSSAIYVYGCGGGLTTTGVGLYTMSAAGQMNLAHCEIGNSGSSTTASSNSSGQVSFYHCDLSFPLSTSSTGNVNFYHTDNICGGINTTAITTAGSGVNLIYNSYVTSGTASAISVGTGTTVEMANSEVSSSNTNAITGAGTLIYGGVVFTGSSSTINTTTQTPIPWPVQQGGTASSSFNINGAIISGTSITSALTSVSLGLQQLLVGNTSAAPTAKSFSVVNQIFTSTGTYTPTSGMIYCSIQCVGGGGGGGGAPSTTGSQVSCGVGGSGGEYATGMFSSSSIGASKSVTIGASGAANSGSAGGNGGTTSVGGLISAAGGNGGASVVAGAGPARSGGTQGGTGGTGGDYRYQGGGGDFSFVVLSPVVGGGGAGGNSFFGAGGIATQLSSAGNNGTGYGSGGSAALNYASASASAGGAGAKGLVVVTEFILS